MINLNNTIAIFFTISSFAIVFQRPIYSHGTGTNCSNECQTYYCPENKQENNQENNNKKSKLNN